MILVKEGVVFKRLIPQILRLLLIAETIWEQMDQVAVVTSANDGVHKDGSLHYQDAALDLRTHMLSQTERDATWGNLKQRLGKDWDVILEAPGTPNEHIHCEYQPKI